MIFKVLKLNSNSLFQINSSFERVKNHKIAECMAKNKEILHLNLSKLGYKPEIQEKFIKTMIKMLELMYEQGDNSLAAFASLTYKDALHAMLESYYLEESLLLDETRK